MGIVHIHDVAYEFEEDVADWLIKRGALYEGGEGHVSLCDKCYAPGYCCKGLYLNRTFWADEGPLKKQVDGFLAVNALPF